MAIEENGGTAAPAESEELSFEQVDALLSFDPFSKKDAPAEPPAADAEAGEVPPAAADAETLPAEQGTGEPPAAPTAPAAQPPTEDPEKVLLKQQLEQMQRDIAAMRQPQQPQQPPEDPNAAVPEYAFNIPDALLEHLRSDNPAEVRAGVGALAQGVARTVHQTVMQQMASLVQTVVPQMVNQGVTGAQMAREIFTDFYGTYKELNVPELRPMIVNVAQQVASEYRASTWSPQLRDEVARRVKAALAQPMAPAIPPSAPAAPKPPTQFGGGAARPAAAPAGSKTQEDIMKTLFG